MGKGPSVQVWVRLLRGDEEAAEGTGWESKSKFWAADKQGAPARGGTSEALRPEETPRAKASQGRKGTQGWIQAAPC